MKFLVIGGIMKGFGTCLYSFRLTLLICCFILEVPEVLRLLSL